MTTRSPLSLFASLILGTALLFSACSKSNPADPGTNSPVNGSWNITTFNGQDVSPYGLSWVFTNNQGTFTGFNGCKSSFSYTTSGSKLFTTVVSDQCADDPVGSRDSATFSINGNTMTLTSAGAVMTLTKGTVTSLPSLVGTWNVSTIDGSPVPNGNTMTLTFDLAEMTQRVVFGGGGSCETAFDYTRTANKIEVEVVREDCGAVNVGDQDLLTYTISGNTLTVVFSDGTTLVASK
jgi:hypothetical protein